jgi:hypothetical protein
MRPRLQLVGCQSLRADAFRTAPLKSAVQIRMKRGGLVAAFLLTLAGCAVAPTKEEMERYFERITPGTPVAKIERQLQLPEPTETEAPAFNWPGWKYKYFTDDLVVYFVAVDEPQADGREIRVYERDWCVWTKAEYWDQIRRICNPKQIASPPDWHQPRASRAAAANR